MAGLLEPHAATLLESVARNIPGVIYRCAVDPDWTMQLIGDEIERITGYPAADFVRNRRRTYGSLIHPDDRDRVVVGVQEALESGRQFELEYRLVVAGGAQRWVLERGCGVQSPEGQWLDGVIFDITERRRLDELSRRAEAEAAAAHAVAESRFRIQRAADDARRRIGRDLHDGAQQLFVSAALTLRLAQRRLPDAPEQAQDLIATSIDQVARGLADLRDLAHGIHPAVLTDRGVGPALEALAATAPVPVRVVDEFGLRLPADIESALYFAAAEAIANVCKHSDARTVGIVVGCADHTVFVEVTDDGVGGASPELGTGLRGLVDRLETVGGRLEVRSPAGGGTSLRARVPLQSDVGRAAPS
jgi:signal transduction histidine kinase